MEAHLARNYFQIYVYNSRHELYIGIKQTGNFQHSSFLYGGRVLSAGLLRAKDGILVSLSPLSGHYRSGSAHFRFFVASLQDSGVNLDHVTLSKSLVFLKGLETYGKVTKKVKGAGHSRKNEAHTNDENDLKGEKRVEEAKDVQSSAKPEQDPKTKKGMTLHKILRKLHLADSPSSSK